MWYLVLYILGQGSAIQIIPEKYPTETACHDAASGNGMTGFSRWSHSCIPAPSYQYPKSDRCQVDIKTNTIVCPVN
jgi:hypothetical protein